MDIKSKEDSDKHLNLSNVVYNLRKPHEQSLQLELNQISVFSINLD